MVCAMSITLLLIEDDDDDDDDDEEELDDDYSVPLVGASPQQVVFCGTSVAQRQAA